MDKSSYLDLLKQTIIGPYLPGEVVLMDTDAPNQKTAVDFYVTEKYLGTPVVFTGRFDSGGGSAVLHVRR